MHMYTLSLLVKHCLRSDAGQQRTVASTGATDDAVKTSTCCCYYCSQRGKKGVRPCSCYNPGVILSEKSSTLLSSAKKKPRNTHTKQKPQGHPNVPPPKRLLQKGTISIVTGKNYLVSATFRNSTVPNNPLPHTCKTGAKTILLKNTEQTKEGKDGLHSGLTSDI